MEEYMFNQLSDQQKNFAILEYQKGKLNDTTYVLMAFFLGGIGAHKFYAGKAGIGVVYALFVWTFIPAVIALIEIFIRSDVKEYNDKLAQELVMKSRMIFPGNK